MSLWLTSRKWIQNLWHILIDDAKAEIVQYGTPAIEFLKANSASMLFPIAETLLTEAATGAPWGGLIAELEKQATAAGVKLLEGGAAAILAYVQTALIAKGTIKAPVA